MIGALIVALIGLVAIQLVLLSVGIRLEKTRFDTQVATVLREVGKQIGQDEELSKQIVEISTYGSGIYVTDTELLYQGVRDTLRDRIGRALTDANIPVRASFALTDQTTELIYAASDTYQREVADHRQYEVLLEGEVIWRCRCLRLLVLHIDNLFAYLLRQLAYLIIPSLFFIVVILLCFVHLLNTLRRQRQLDNIKNDFINNLTHELKTPVFSIALTTKILEETIRRGKPEKVDTLIGLIRKENDKLKTRINKVLELASLESSTQALSFASVDLHQLMHELLEELHTETERSGATVDREWNATYTTVNADATHLKNAFRNLLENAFKYTADQPHITLQTTNETGTIRIVVRDNGVGIPKEALSRVFDKFYRVPTGDLHRVKGFGLGLNYVQQIVRAHGGSVSVQSKPGEGSSFVVDLPVKM